jgi:hypothetical protein
MIDYTSTNGAETVTAVVSRKIYSKTPPAAGYRRIEI